MAADTQPRVLIHVPKNDVQIASLKNLINSTYNMMLAIVFQLSLWYCKMFCIDLKEVLCRIKWSFFQVHSPKHTRVT